MTEPRTAAIRYALEHRNRFLEDLITFSSIPSVSTDPAHQEDMHKAASWVADKLRQLGASQVKIYPTAGHPVVYGELGEAGPGATTVLVYGHYDVQPAEPLELWKSDPFTPSIRGENIYARGVSDMKAQVLVTMHAVEALKDKGRLPVNLKFLYEGEEEIGSPNLGLFITGHKELLAADFALNLDAGMIAEDVPCISYGLRGLAYFELNVYGPSHDLHSGIYGGVVHNPAQALCELVAGMHDAQERVSLPGFYDKVRPLEAEERGELGRLPMDEAFYLKQTGAPALWGEQGYSPVERTGARPTLEVNGLLSGFTGEGSKTVLPAKAMAKISMRLVPDQDPAEVHRQLLQYLEEKAPQDIRWEVINLAGGVPSISERNLPAVQAFSRALEKVWGTRPAFKREGGSVPVVAQMQELLGIESVLSGFSLLDDNAHGPNEKLHLPTWYRGIDTVVHFLCNLQP